jgi:hypothetical protein
MQQRLYVVALSFLSFPYLSFVAQPFLLALSLKGAVLCSM